MLEYKNKLVKKDVIYEGLIHSTSLTRTFDHLSRWSLIADNSNFRKSGDKILLIIGEQPTISEIDNLEKMLLRLGWFISMGRILTSENKEDSIIYNSKFWETVKNNKLQLLQIEPKFVPELELYEYDTLYHVTPSISVPKILKIGLCPRSKNKTSSHPDRVFLTKDEDDAIFLAKKFRKLNDKYKSSTILEVNFAEACDNDTSIRLFQDVNFVFGVFTLSNIPPKYIKSIRTINLN